MSARQAPAATMLALAASLAGTPPADAQVVKQDPSMIAQIASTVSQLSTELQQVTVVLGTVTAVLGIQRNVSGALGALGIAGADLGGATLGQVVQDAQMGMEAFQQAQGAAEMISGTIHDLVNDPLSSFSLLGVLQAVNGYSSGGQFSQDPLIRVQVGALNAVMSGTLPVPEIGPTINNNLYVTTTKPTSDDIEAVNAARQALISNAAVTAMATAAGTGQSIGNTAQSGLGTLSGAIANSQDERGDFKANSGALLKMLEQMQASNGLLSHVLYLDSAGAMGTAGTYSPLQPVPPPNGPQTGQGPNGSTSGPGPAGAFVVAGSFEQYDGQAVGTGQCVALVQAADPAVGNTSTWRQGPQVTTATNLQPGTIIATFGPNGTYTNSTNGDSHAAIYKSTNPDGSINVVDQWVNHNASDRTINVAGTGQANTASQFYVVTHA